MFVTDFVTVDLPLAEVERRLVEEADPRLSEHVLAADDASTELRVRVGPEVAGRRMIGRRVRLSLGPPRPQGDRVLLALQWDGTGTMGALFPTLDADLELAPLGAITTQISLFGRYEPPLQLIGHGIDRLLLHRVAQATVRTFLRRLGEGLASGPSDALISQAH